jgi:hypothetical protein
MEATASQRYAYDNGFVPMVKDDSSPKCWIAHFAHEIFSTGSV